MAQQKHWTEWDCVKTKVRFSDALLVSHRIIQRQRMQKVFKWSGFAVGTERPKSKRSIKFSVDLPQPAYAFVRAITVHISFFAGWHWWHIGGAPTNQHKTGSRPPPPPPQKKKKKKKCTKKTPSPFNTRHLMARGSKLMLKSPYLSHG